MENDELIKRAEDLARRCEKTASVTHTAFLTPAEQYALEQWSERMPDCNMLLFRVYSNKTISHDTQRTTIYSMILDYKGTKY